MRDFINFSQSIGIRDALPASPTTLALWLTKLACPPRSLALSTCKGYLAAVLTFHVESGFDHPLRDAPPLVDRILTGIKRLTASSHTPVKNKLPITTELLRSFERHLSLNALGDSLLWAMFWVGTIGMLRISEFTIKNSTDDRPLRCSQLTALDYNNRPVDLFTRDTNHQEVPYFSLHLEASKTDPLRVGVDIVLANRTTIEAVCNYLHLRRLRRRSPVPLSMPLFTYDEVNYVGRPWLMLYLNRLLVLEGKDPTKYSSHSFRKGGATSMQAHGAPDSLIRQQGRWKSDAMHLYLRHPSLDRIIATTAQL